MDDVDELVDAARKVIRDEIAYVAKCVEATLNLAKWGDSWETQERASNNEFGTYDTVAVDDDATKAAKSDWAKHPNHELHDIIVATFAPKLKAALTPSKAQIAAAIASAKKKADVEAAKAIALNVMKAAGANPNLSPIQQAAQDAMSANTIAPDEAQNILRMIYGNAYLAGSHTAVAQIGGGATLMQGLDEADAAADWSSWTPGWEAAGDAVADGGLADLLGNAGITIQSVAENAIGRLGNVLADGISAGDSVDTISNAIADSVGGNADLIANTETARAMQTATMDTYDANGVDQWDWLAEDSACEICLDAADNGPYDVGDDPDPTIPAHPRCRCAATPVIKIPGLADNEIPGGDESDDQD